MSAVPSPLNPTPAAAPVAQAPVLPFFVTVENHLLAIASPIAAGLAAVQSDLAQGQKLQSFNDSIATAAATLAAVLPSQSANIAMGLQFFSTGEAIAKSFFDLFHHPAAKAALAANPPVPATAK